MEEYLYRELSDKELAELCEIMVDNFVLRNFDIIDSVLENVDIEKITLIGAVALIRYSFIYKLKLKYWYKFKENCLARFKKEMDADEFRKNFQGLIN